MSEVHKFIFDGMPVRGTIVRLTDAWTEVLKRRQSNRETGAYPLPVSSLLGEMLAAGVLMQSSIKFNGALILQIMGDGPVKLVVAEVQPDLSMRATATVSGPVSVDAKLSEMVNQNNLGRCAITLDPHDRFPGQQPYQGVVPLHGDQRQKLEEVSDVLSHYMLQSEQLDTMLVLAADERVAAGLLIQRMPLDGAANLGGMNLAAGREDEIGLNEDYKRISILASTLEKKELLELDADTILRRLFWEERLTRFSNGEPGVNPRFACSCSREKVSRMIVGLGESEAQSILEERNEIEVSCEFCGLQYRFDAIDTTQLFQLTAQTPPASQKIQ